MNANSSDRSSQPVQPVPASEPFGYYVYVPAEQRGEFVFDLDEALDDLTNCECEVTELRAAPTAPASAPATPAPIEPVKVTDPDGERYRWLRPKIEKHGGLVIAESDGFALRSWSGDDPDRAIDEARAKESAPATQDKGEGA